MALNTGKPAPLHLPVYQVNESTFNIPAPLGIVVGYGGGNYQLPPLQGIVSGAMLYVNNYGADLTLQAAEDNTITFYDPDTGTHVLDQVTVKAGSCAQYTTDFVGTWYQLGYQTPVAPPAPPSDAIAPVRAATVRALASESWASAVVFGAGTINVTTTGTPIIDGVTLVLNDRVLIRNNSPNNGIYSVTALSAGLLQFTITDDIVVQTSIASVTSGTTNLQQRFALYGTQWTNTGVIGTVTGLGNNIAALNTAGNLVYGTNVTSAVLNSILIGNEAGIDATGTGHLMIGPRAGERINGNNNICHGPFAGINATSTGSMFFGERAGVAATGNNKTCFGALAGSSSSSTDMCAMGRESGRSTTGTFGAYFGRRAGDGSTGNYQVHLGSNTGNGVLADYAICGGFDAGSGSLGDNLIAFGFRAGYQNFGSGGVFIGNGAGNTNATGDQLVGLGAGALTAFVGDYGIGTGYFALANANGLNLLGLGVEAGSQTIGNDNVFVGYTAGLFSTGQQMTIMGNSSGISSLMANNLTVYGFFSGTTCYGENNNIFGANTANEFGGSNNCVFGNNMNYCVANYNILIGNDCCVPVALGDTNIIVGRNNTPSNATNVIQLGSGLSCNDNSLRTVQIGTNLSIVNNNTNVVQIGYTNLCRTDSVQIGANNISFVDNVIAIGIGNTVDTPNSIAMGFNAKAVGINSIAFGSNALTSSVAGAANNTAFGSNAGRNVTTGTQNTAFGANALFYNTTGINNCAFGSGALGTNALSTQAPSSYGNNSAFGQNAMCFHFTGDFNVAMGSSALRGALPASIAPANNVNSSNTAVGNECMNFVFLSDMNTAVGRDVLKHAGKCTSNVGVGYQSMFCPLAFLTTSNPINNTAMGAAALTPTTGAAATFNNNCSFGFNSMNGIAPALANTCAYGAQTLQVVTTNGHCAFGFGALRVLSSGTNCAAYGLNSLTNCSTGSSNCAYGPSTGAGITTQSNAVLFGVGANSTTGTAVAIGNGIVNNNVGTAAIGNVGVMYVCAAASGALVDGDTRTGYYNFGAPISLVANAQSLDATQFSPDQLIIFTGGTAAAVAITLPTGASVIARFPGMRIGTGFDIRIRNTSTNTLNLSSGDVVAANTVVLYRVTMTAAAAYTVQRIGSMGV